MNTPRGKPEGDERDTMDKLTTERLHKLTEMQARAMAAGFTLEGTDVFWVKGTALPLIDAMDGDEWLDAMTAE